MNFPKADTVAVYRVFEVKFLNAFEENAKRKIPDIERGRGIYSWRADFCFQEDAELYLKAVALHEPKTVHELYYLRDGNFNDEAERIRVSNICPDCGKDTKTIYDNMIGNDFLCESCGAIFEGTDAHKRRAARLAMEFYSEGATNGKN